MRPIKLYYLHIIFLPITPRIVCMFKQLLNTNYTFLNNSYDDCRLLKTNQKEVARPQYCGEIVININKSLLVHYIA
jgi:hypothetical protein